MADLGRWLSGDYRVPVPETDDETPQSSAGDNSDEPDA